jgi:hypothetical protein
VTAIKSTNVTKSVEGSAKMAERADGHAIMTGSTKSLVKEGANWPNQVMESVIRPTAVMNKMFQIAMVTERAIRSLTVNDSVIKLAISFGRRWKVLRFSC